MEKGKKITKFPKGFFQKERPTVTLKEALEEIIPVEWVEKKKENKVIKSKNKISFN